jgi:hypothetical protein
MQICKYVNKVLTAEGEAVGAVGEALVGASGGALDVAGGAVVGGAGDLVVALVVPVGDDGGVLGVGRHPLGVPRLRRLGRLLDLPFQQILRRGRVPRRRQRQRHHQQGGDGAAADHRHCRRRPRSLGGGERGGGAQRQDREMALDWLLCLLRRAGYDAVWSDAVDRWPRAESYTSEPEMEAACGFPAGARSPIDGLEVKWLDGEVA